MSRAIGLEPRQIFDAMTEAWNSRNPAGMLVYMAEQAEYVNGVGFWWRGHAALERGFSMEIARGGPRIQKMEQTQHAITPDCVILTTRVASEGVTLSDGQMFPPGQGIMTMVFHRRDAGWIMVAGQTTLVNLRAQVSPPGQA